MSNLTPNQDVTPRRILLVDDDPVVRLGLSHVINEEPDLSVCGEAHEAHQAVETVTNMKPDLAVVELDLELAGGLGLIKKLQAHAPDMPILVLSSYDETIYAMRAIRAGARGYLRKRAEPLTILTAVRKVLHGEIALSERMASQALHIAVHGRPRVKNDCMAQLTDRELEVLQFIGQGYSTSEIAQQLGRSVKTVETHRLHIMKKLQLDHARHLLRYAVHSTVVAGQGLLS